MAQEPYHSYTLDDIQPASAPESAPSTSTVDTFIAKFTEGGNMLVSLLSKLLAAFLILYSGYALYDTTYTMTSARNSWDVLEEIIVEDGTPLAQAVAAITPNYRCWLTVYDTKIDYPVVQGEDDLFYASHDIYGKSSLTGAIYLAANNSGDFSDSYNLIYGHHMADGIMFGALDYFETESYFNSHRTGEIITDNRVYDLNFFAVLDTNAYEPMVYRAGSRDLDELRAWLKQYATFYDEEAAEGDKIVALSTCRDATTSGRLVIFATMTERMLLDLTVTDYNAPYDAQTHSAADQIHVNLPEDTTVEYTTDGGVTWSKTPPTVQNVMRDGDGTVQSLAVTVRAFNEQYGRAEKTFTMTVTPKPVTVTADAAEKFYGDPDPAAYTAVTTGTLGSDTVSYTVSRAEGENVGTYPITPAGETEQGNYTVNYVAGTFTIKPKPGITLTPHNYKGTYDGQSHTASADCSDPEALVEYSTDGGVTWSTTLPSIRNVVRNGDNTVGEITALVRATRPNYETATATVTLKVNPATVTVTAVNSGKIFDTEDPTLTAIVSGTVGSESVSYTVTRAEGEDVGTYAITPAGEAEQGNYHVNYVPGTFTISPADGLRISATGYTGTYDGQTHSVIASASAPDGSACTIEYSTDGGLTWVTTAPSITNVIRNADNSVGSQTVLVRATNPNYDPSAPVQVALQLNPKAVTVRSLNRTKTFGTPDPDFTDRYNSLEVLGLLPGENVTFTVSRAPGEALGTYAITPTGAAQQGNYSVTYIPGTLTITPLGILTLTANGYIGVYDGVTHYVQATANVPGATVAYSVNGGPWTTTPPSRLNVGADTVRVRATMLGYEPVEIDNVDLIITYRPVTVTANNATKPIGTADPVFTATVTGTIGGDRVNYTLGREPGEALGTYAITPTGAVIQGNYSVTYVPGTLTITAAAGGGNPNNPQPPTQPPAPEEIEDIEPPLAQFVNGFRPTGGTHGDRAWALVNLICLLTTIYLFVPLLHLKDKYGRIKQMKKLNDEKTELFDKPDLEEEERQEREKILDTAVTMKSWNDVRATLADITGEDFADAVEILYYHVTEFVKRFRLGFGLELVDVIAAIIAFILTEDMRLPMVLIDKWTPLMLILLVICWVLDVRLMRYRDEVPAEEEEKAEEEKQAQPV